MRDGRRNLYRLTLVVSVFVTGCAAASGPGPGNDLPPVADTKHPRMSEQKLSRISTEDNDVRHPGRWRGERLRPDIMVVAQHPLPVWLRSRVREIPGVRAAATFALASTAMMGRPVSIAGVDPDSYRRFTPQGTADTDELWQTVAAGDVALTHQLGRQLRQPLGSTLEMGHAAAVPLRVGAYATTVPRIDAVVDRRRGVELGMTPGNAMLVSAPTDDRARITAAIDRLVPGKAVVEELAQAPQTGKATPRPARQTAYLTGGAVASALGSFSYRPQPDGTVRPDSRWVANNIATEIVPILGRVTCHRVMLPQLNAALTEIVRRGLADTINPGDYGGCYVPRFIAHDPSQGLSLHTWGSAIDLNVAGNQRGTAGDIDRRVVAVFKKWGFAWGGNWQWTDPMHFELAALVRSAGPAG